MIRNGAEPFDAGLPPDLPSELRHRSLTDSLPIGVMCCRAGRITYLNDCALRMLGMDSLDEVVSRPFLDFVDPELRDLAEARGGRLLRGEEPDSTMVRQRLLRADGSVVEIDVVTVSFEDAHGSLTYSWAVDVTEQVRAERALQESEQRWRSLVENASDIIAVLEPDGTLRSFTPAAERVLGLYEEGAGTSIADHVHPDDLGTVMAAIVEVGTRPGAQTRTEFRVARPDGTWCWLESIATNRIGDPAVRGIVCNVRDVSERRIAEDMLRHHATHDALTGLPNRLALTDAISAAAGAGTSTRAALLLLDLDGFKDINEGLGHDAGDRVLRDVAGRLQSRMRADDLVARLGGDEFAVWIPGSESARQATVVAGKLLRALGEPFELDGAGIGLAASIGIARMPDHGTTPTALLQAARVALHRAKEQGTSWALHGAADDRERRHRLTVISQLRRAIDDEVLEVHYQPQIDLASGTAVAAEALVRWGPALGGPMMPDEFIPLAERTGLIRPLTTFVLGRALAQCRSWRDQGIDVGVAVNLSPTSLRDVGLPNTVARALAEWGLPGTSLTLEITESGLADPTPALIRLLAQLRKQGVRIAVDDLGIGYSSLSYLKHLPVTEVKIDKSFLLGASDERDRALVRALVELGHSLRLTVVAEGVEDATAHGSLVDAGCDRAQGYLYCRPGPADAITAWLESAARSSAGERAPTP